MDVVRGVDSQDIALAIPPPKDLAPPVGRNFFRPPIDAYKILKIGIFILAAEGPWGEKVHYAL